MEFTLPDIDIVAYSEQKKQLEAKLQDPELIKDQQQYAKLHQQYKEVDSIVSTYKDLENKINNYQDTEILLEDPEMATAAADELQQLETRIQELQQKLEDLTLPQFQDDEKDAIVEIRAGAGGTEASLFAEEILGMYTKTLVHLNYTVEPEDTTYNEEGGIKEVTFSVNGAKAFGYLRFESGVHRVQRVPTTESSGRLHTSSISVVVLPKLEATNVEIKDNEIEIDTYRSSGPGGQSVNTTDSAVRITHVPTGIVVSCQDGKSQHKNKEKAMSILASKLYSLELEKNASAENSIRAEAIKGGDRSVKIRTYNYPQSRISDHRVNLNWSNLKEIVGGDAEEMITSVGKAMRKKYA